MKPIIKHTLLLGTMWLIASARFTAALAGSVTLGWNQETDPIVGGYVLYYGNLSGVYTNALHLNDVAITNVTVTNLNQGTTYYFMTTAMSVEGLQSLRSDEVSATVPTTWNAVSNLLFTSVTSSSATFNWAAVDSGNIAGYTLYYVTNGGKYDNAAYFDGATNTSTVNGLVNGMTYYVLVKAVDVDGRESLPSNVASNTILVVISTNASPGIQLQMTNTSPYGVQSPASPIWLHVIFSSPVTNAYVFQDSLDLQNWYTIGPPQINLLTSGWFSVSLATHLSASYFRVNVKTNY